MKELNIREMRANIGRLDELVAVEGELVVNRRGKPIARILPMSEHRQLPDHADLRQRMARLQRPSEELIREERDER
ncbi:type II toxin-antitoxin system Phd/YefM family antitoxin [Spiribacter sp. 1M153]|jgi:antitoxin (DNA-binding transcriptional repressor) of toxin-antitoxin stability system|uniref:type II toxin-antitoxin system Phd/YefM family antitoxin n=1 Tax=Spiribacter TaxID=1335745 RepID=UPI001C945D37|nr:type II toxin-antitoxin system Phd/YefM family antitoxin [Spiribacter salinus]MBY5269429.1 prevent-host-death protein [Spiribacter salinus]